MIKYYPNSWEIENWKILDTKIIHNYDEKETPIEIVNVQIGTLERIDMQFNNNFTRDDYIITRWITKNEYNHLKQNSGIIIW